MTFLQTDKPRGHILEAVAESLTQSDDASFWSVAIAEVCLRCGSGVARDATLMAGSDRFRVAGLGIGHPNR